MFSTYRLLVVPADAEVHITCEVTAECRRAHLRIYLDPATPSSYTRFCETEAPFKLNIDHVIPPHPTSWVSKTLTFVFSNYKFNYSW